MKYNISDLCSVHFISLRLPTVMLELWLSLAFLPWRTHKWQVRSCLVNDGGIRSGRGKQATSIKSWVNPITCTVRPLTEPCAAGNFIGYIQRTVHTLDISALLAASQGCKAPILTPIHFSNDLFVRFLDSSAIRADPWVTVNALWTLPGTQT